MNLHNARLLFFDEERLNELADLVATKVIQLSKQKEKESEPFSEYPEFLSRTQAAKVMNCSPSTIDKLRREGILPVYKNESIGRPRFKKTEVLALYERKENDW